MTKQSFKDRLLLLIAERADGNKTKFAEMLGVTPGNINNWINLDYLPAFEHLANMYAKFNVNINWLLLGEGGKYYFPVPLRVGGKDEGLIRETTPPYGMFLADVITDEEKQYIKKLIRLFHTKQEKTVMAIKQNIDAFLDTPNKGKVKKTANE